MNMSTIFRYVTSLKFLFYFIVIATILISLQQYHISVGHLGNAIIFRSSFYNLINHLNIYAGGQIYLTEKLDLFKYSPAFAFLYFPFAIGHVVPSAVLWNLFNAIILFYAVKSLPFNDSKKAIILGLSLLELFLSVQNFQSNALMTALLIFAFTSLEKRNTILATFCIVLSIYIKLFGVIALLFFFFYPQKLKFILSTILWSILLFLLPLIVVSFHELIDLYKNWGLTLKNDESISWGLSMMAIVKSWFGVDLPKTLTQILGMLALCIPLTQYKSYKNLQFRLLYICSILLWVVTFNHKSESPSFIIAVTGMAIWLVMEGATPTRIFLCLLAIAVTSLAHSDLLPLSFRVNYVDVYVIKGLPAFVLWVVIQYNIYILAFKPQPLPAQGSTDELQK